jgi:serine/threonine-protein kinase RsbW
VTVASVVDATCITLTFPAGPEHIRLARLVASGLVAQLDYGLDDVEDLRIAVDELCALVVAHAQNNSTLTVSFELRDDVITVRAAAPSAHPEKEIEADELSRLILLAAADEHLLSQNQGDVVGWLRKRPAMAAE